MDAQALRDQIIHLADAAGLVVLNEDEHRQQKDACWIDAKVRCPYGSPEGQYRLRPEGFCDNRCLHFERLGANLLTRREADKEIEDSKDAAVCEYFANKSVPLAKLIRETTHHVVSDVERRVLHLAADIIQTLRVKVLSEGELPSNDE